MSINKSSIKFIIAALTLLGGFLTSAAYAAIITLEYDTSFGAVAPDGAAPWATAIFDDGGTAGSVTLTMSVASTVGDADLRSLYFNLDSLLDPTALSFNRTGGTGPSSLDTGISTGVDSFKAGGDGFYDILFDFPTSNQGGGSKRFNAGEGLTYEISGIGSLTANDFNFLSSPSGGAGPFRSAGQFLSTGPLGEDSDWVGVSAVPVPAAVWLFGSGLLAFAGVARRK